MAYLEQTDSWQSYIAVQLAGLDTAYSRDDRYIEWEIDGRSAGSSSVSAGASSSGSQYFINLSPNTTYYITATIYYSSTPDSGIDSSSTFSGSFSTTEKDPDPDPEPEPDPRPDYFYWDTSKVSGEKFNLTASEWNNLRSNINLVRNYLGYARYAFQSVQSGEVFTASDYNEAAYLINGISEYSGYISSVSSGQKIYASQLNELRDAINSV